MSDAAHILPEKYFGNSTKPISIDFTVLLVNCLIFFTTNEIILVMPLESRLTLSDVSNALDAYFRPLGLEIHPFKVGWYNESVSAPFMLPFNDNTIAFVIISSPSMFERAFIPYLKKNLVEIAGGNKSRDPLDSALTYHFQKAKCLFASEEIDVIQDFEILPNKRPKILVQTAAHIAGASFYYQKKDVENLHDKGCDEIANNSSGGDRSLTGAAMKVDGRKNNMVSNPADKPYTSAAPWEPKEKIFGVCIHPKYGGWFAIRGVMIFRNLQGNIQRRDPINCVASRRLKIELLTRFNRNWRDGSYRDIIPVIERYSELQIKYFNTEPKDRHELIAEIYST